MITYVDQNWSNQICRAPADRNNGASTGARNPDGTFAPGNPGRPAGARHCTTRAVEELLQGEAAALSRKAVDMALEGDTTALRLCLERVAPARKDAPVSFDLPPLESAQDAAKAAQAILQAVSQGDLTPMEGTGLMGLCRELQTDVRNHRAGSEAQISGGADMQVNGSVLAGERQAGLLSQPMVMWVKTVTVNDDGTKDMAREAVVIWTNGDWQLLEAAEGEREEAFQTRILSLVRNGPRAGGTMAPMAGYGT